MFYYFINYPANGFAWMVTLFIRFSTTGRYVFGLTASFSSSSNASKPSITLLQKEKIKSTNFLPNPHPAPQLTSRTVCTWGPAPVGPRTWWKTGSRSCSARCWPSRSCRARCVSARPGTRPRTCAPRSTDRPCPCPSGRPFARWIPWCSGGRWTRCSSCFRTGPESSRTFSGIPRRTAPAWCRRRRCAGWRTEEVKLNLVKHPKFMVKSLFYIPFWILNVWFEVLCLIFFCLECTEREVLVNIGIKELDYFRAVSHTRLICFTFRRSHIYVSLN